MSGEETFIYIFMAVPYVLILVALIRWINKKGKPCALYFNGESIYKYDLKPDTQGNVEIKGSFHNVDGVEPILFKDKMIGIKQFAYFVHHDRVKAVSLRDFLNENKTALQSDISPETMNKILEGADIKATHQTLNSMKFNWKNPTLLAGLGMGLAVGVIGTLVLYNPNVPIQVVEVVREPIKQVGNIAVASFLMW